MDEHSTISKIKAGDTAAWEALIELVGDRLFRAACLMCRNDQEAEDAVQETFLRFSQSLSRFRGESSVYTWLYGILLNVVRKEKRFFSRMVVTDNPPEISAACPAGGSGLDRQAEAEALMTAMRKLSPEHRMVLALRYYDQLSVCEIALKLGVSAGTIKSRLFHARQLMSVLVPESLNPFAS